MCLGEIRATGDVMLNDVIADVRGVQISSRASFESGSLHSCPALSVVSCPGPLSPLVPALPACGLQK